jgi:hypothetical protein
MKSVIAAVLLGAILAPGTAVAAPAPSGHCEGGYALSYIECVSAGLEWVSPARAIADPDLLDSDTGYGRAAVFAWSRGYRHVGVVASYSGHAVVRFTIDCAGYANDDRLSWDDGGPNFRYTQTVPTFGRCDYTAVVRTRGSFIRLGIGAW